MLLVEDLRRPDFLPLSLRLAAGECLVLRGESGAGKSLLLRAIADLDPAQGAVSWQGRPRESMSGPEWRRLVGYLPAEPGWWDNRVGDHFLRWSDMAADAERLGLPAEAGDWPISRPSTGERARLALLRALERQPAVLLLDEPTGSLDPKATLAVESLLGDRRAAGLALLWVTHDPDQARRVASRRLVLSQGLLHEEPL